jgi:TRAP-type C4-dicarboxylate transport system substrate-binding protein
MMRNHSQEGTENIMKRSDFIKGMLVAGVAAASLSLAAPAAFAQAKWNLPAAYPSDNPHTENLATFAKDVEAATSGKLAITVHANAALFKAPEIKRAVQTGQAQMGEVLMSLHENEDPVFGIDVVPFLATSFVESKKLYAASKAAVEKKLDSQGIKLLFMVPWAPQGVYAKKEINTVEDMKGLKWRAYNVGTTRLGELLGMQAVTIQAAELPQALATGVVNSFMSSGGTGYDSKAWETLTHFYDVQAWIPKNATFVNKAAFAGLDKPTQDAILKASADAEARGWKLWEEKTNWYLDQLKSKGMKVNAPSPALKDGFKKAGETLTADWLKKAGADGQAIVDAYKKM